MNVSVSHYMKNCGHDENYLIVPLLLHIARTDFHYTKAIYIKYTLYLYILINGHSGINHIRYGVWLMKLFEFGWDQYNLQDIFRSQTNNLSILCGCAYCVTMFHCAFIA